MTRLTQSLVSFYSVNEDGRSGRVPGFAQTATGDHLVATYGGYGGGALMGPLDDLKRADGLKRLPENPFPLTALKKRSGEVLLAEPSMLLKFVDEINNAINIPTQECIHALAKDADGATSIGSREGALLKMVGDQLIEIAKFNGLISGLVAGDPGEWWIGTGD